MASLPSWVNTYPENTTDNSTISDYDELLSLKYKIGVPMIVFCGLCYVVISLMCILFNGLLCWLIIFKTPEAHKSTDYFILNLAISDLLVGIFCIPFTLINHIFTENQLGDVMCKMTPFIQGTAVGSSVFTLAAVAVDRIRMLFNPPGSHFTGRQIAVTVGTIWVAAAATMLPQALYRHETAYPIPLGRSISLCVEDWPLSKLYTLLLFVICYLIPLLVTGGLYITICIHLWYKKPAGEDEAARQKTLKMKQVIKMLITIVAMFALSWLPLYACWILEDFGPLSFDQKVIMMSYVNPIAHLLAFSNSCVNPVVYGYFRPQLRREGCLAMYAWCVCGGAKRQAPAAAPAPPPQPMQLRQAPLREHRKLQRLQYV
ncbi:PREDICTED: neuropeptide FF receptor 2-like [Branchiostoma belcheri]|uniref:Neuropeptide FF receptor 2-like n=1 Tax=Branchiostoma belcheri TaxID=7741 RepID=A0A6P4XTA6_BRABE|nr:PREDICTED: neuropeptide FF receptor 2-like [Branchiostoma belcheri]